MPSHAYFENSEGVGDWYVALAQVNPGQSPATHPEKWMKLALPDFFEPYLVEKASAYLMGQDGQSDKRRAHEATAEAYLDELTMRHSDIGAPYAVQVFTR